MRITPPAVFTLFEPVPTAAVDSPAGEAPLLSPPYPTATVPSEPPKGPPPRLHPLSPPADTGIFLHILPLLTAFCKEQRRKTFRFFPDFDSFLSLFPALIFAKTIF
jgi:hypothetical protein